MKLEKQKLCTLPECYAVSAVERGGQLYYVLATDAAGACKAVNSATLECETVWETPGGTMSLVPLPGKDGEFLAVQRFLPGFQAAHAEIVHARRTPAGWQVNTFLSMPYVHRFDILRRGGVSYLLFCILCEKKEHEDDWSTAGWLYAAELPDDFSAPVSLTRIAQGMHRNHGYLRAGAPGEEYALTSCDEGVFEVMPPEQRGGEWTVKRILERAVSDIALCDIDGDGVDELAAIEPFHGGAFRVYRRTADGWALLYDYPAGPSAFFHVAWGGTLRGEPVFIGGCRAGNKELFLLRWKNGAIVPEILERGMGPSNVYVRHGAECDVIVAANREGGEGALFTVRSEDLL